VRDTAGARATSAPYVTGRIEMKRTSRVRRRLNVVELNPASHELRKPPAEEPTPATDSEVSQPDSDEQAGLDAASTGMALLLRLTLRFMRSYDASPTRRNRGRGR
jgi:hypothetical protein